MTLQYRPDTDALRYHRSGANAGSLMSECCNCNPCNDCEPPLAQTYTATVSGLMGAMASLNGVHILHYMDYYCEWYSNNHVSPYCGITGFYSGGLHDEWSLRIYDGDCGVSFIKEGQDLECNPLGVYAYYGSTGCGDDQSGAAVVVS